MCNAILFLYSSEPICSYLPFVIIVCLFSNSTDTFLGEGENGGWPRSSSDYNMESNILRKVASLTLDKATIEQKVNKPKFLPEKLDFKLYEKFEGMQYFIYIYFLLTFDNVLY